MTASLPAATAAVPVSGSGHSSGESSIEGPRHRRVAFRVPAKPKLWLLASKVTADGSSNSSPTPAKEKVDLKPKPSPYISDASISEFMTQISGLMKLVDSRDIVELQLKQNDCELVIRKKEALLQPPASASVVMMQSPATAIPPQYAPPFPSASHPALPAPGQAPPTAAKAPTSSLPSMKSPMAGTFYRRRNPEEAPFVEAEQAGKIVEVLVEDGKPVSVDMPLFVIEP